MKNFIEKYKHGWILSYAFLYLPWFLYLEGHVTTNYHVMHTIWDDFIPFSEYFIIPYLLWFLYIPAVIAYFFFTSREEYYRLCTILFTGMTVSLIICTFFKNGTDLRPVINPDKNFCSMLVNKLHQADTNTNVFPSVHAFNSICAHIAVTRSPRLKKYPAIQIGSLLLAAAICASTVILKQHSTADILGACIMAYVLYPFVYGNAYEIYREKFKRKTLSENHQF